jgi:hypothetical protein
MKGGYGIKKISQEQNTAVYLLHDDIVPSGENMI